MRRTLPLLYIAFILLVVALADTGNLGPLVRLAHQLPYGDKSAHMLLAIGLACAADLAFGRVVQIGRVTLRAPHVWLPVIVLLEELLQAFVPGRTCDAGDFLADTMGMTLGFGLAFLVRRSPRQAAAHHGSVVMTRT